MFDAEKHVLIVLLLFLRLLIGIVRSGVLLGLLFTRVFEIAAFDSYRVEDGLVLP